MSSDKNNAELSFEDALERLNEIVHKLEKGDKKLEDSISLFEEGVKLSRFCKEILQDAAEKVEGFKKDE